MTEDIHQAQINASARAALACNEFAASLRAMQMASLDLREMSAITGLTVAVLDEILNQWGLDT